MGIFRREQEFWESKNWEDLQYPSDAKQYLQTFTNRLQLHSIAPASCHVCTNGLLVTDVFSVFLIRLLLSEQSEFIFKSFPLPPWKPGSGVNRGWDSLVMSSGVKKTACSPRGAQCLLFFNSVWKVTPWHQEQKPHHKLQGGNKAGLLHTTSPPCLWNLRAE